MSLLDEVLGRNPAHVSHKLKGDKRLPHESYEAYRRRRAEEQRLLDNYLEGDLVWCAKAFKSKQFGTTVSGEPIEIMVPDDQLSQGTYIKKKHGIKRSPRRTV